MVGFFIDWLNTADPIRRAVPKIYHILRWRGRRSAALVIGFLHQATDRVMIVCNTEAFK
jgi:hypothetical protein